MSLLIMFAFTLLPGIVFHGRCLYVWRVNLALGISGGILRRTCFPLEVGEGHARGWLCLPCLIRESCTAAVQVCTRGQACRVMLTPSSTPTGVLKLRVLEQVAWVPPITLPTTIYLVFLLLLLLDRQSKALNPASPEIPFFL